jgi:ABC-type transporter Mla subunit MlaD
MREHHEELLQDVAEISHQYNELQQLIQTKQIMITDETAKSTDDVNRYFDVYIDQLRDTQKKIIANMEVAKQNAQVTREKILMIKVCAFIFV